MEPGTAYKPVNIRGAVARPLARVRHSRRARDTFMTLVKPQTIGREPINFAENAAAIDASRSRRR